QEMKKKEDDLLEMQQAAETRRRNQVKKGRAKASRPSSSDSSEPESEEKEKVAEEKEEDKQMAEESETAKEPEQEDKQMAEESKAAKEPEQEDKQMAEESEAAKEPEQEEEAMSMAEAIRQSYRITDETIASLLEDDKMSSIRSVMLTLEDPIQDFPTAYGAKLERLAIEFTEGTGPLQEAVDRTEEAEAEMKKMEADAEIAEADEILKNIAMEAENLQAGKKTVKETLNSSQRFTIMLKDTVEQMKSATAEDEELKSRLFQEEAKKEKNPQLAMLKMMMNKRKLAGGSVTPVSGVSLSETKEGGEQKKVRGSDKPSEPKLPPRVKPEPKSAPDVLKDKERKEREAESPAGKDEKGGRKRLKMMMERKVKEAVSRKVEEKKERATIFTAEVTLPKEPIVPNPKWGEESKLKPAQVKKPEEKKMPTKDRKEKEKKEKKDEKDKKEKKEKKEKRVDGSPEKYSEKDVRDTE
ncbi:unnamed protein product, partial [Symbiodinium necroappetens]